MYDLAVIGGGPAGTSAAITAADYGARVLLLEKGSFPRQKVCGEFISAESLALLASLLPASCEILDDAPRIRHGRVFIDNRVLKAPVEPAAASIARVDLDVALWNSARERGVDARDRHCVSAIEGDGPFVIRTADKEFTSRSVVDASGRWSNLNPRETPNGAAHKWLGFKAHFREADPANSVDLYFFEGGYCGVQPVGKSRAGEINACAMVRGDVAKSLEECFLQNPRLQDRVLNWERLTDVVATSPLLFHTPEPLQGRILRAGDAAGFVDPFVGDGISLGLRSGELAARTLRSVMQGRGSLQQATEEYQQSYQREFGRVFRSSSKIRQLLSYPAPIRAGILSILVNLPALTRRMVSSTR